MAKRILIVDDDESILDALTLILEELGYEIQTVFKGHETYKAVKSFNPNLILLDVLMSGNDGRHICSKLKQQKTTQHIPIIMMSAHPTAAKGALSCGAEAFLAKPFDTDKLLEKVEQYIA